MPKGASVIPLVDLKAQYRALRPRMDRALRLVLERGVFIGGEEVRAFEAEFAAACGVAGAVGVGNGTDALALVLRALGVGPGDEVVTVAHTFIATAEAVSSTGARPVFVDVREDTLLMDPDAVEGALTPRTKVLIPVHLYGQTCDMDAIMDIARRRGLKVVEDAAQAHGARWRGARAGSIGHAACFSFYPGKNLGAYGDAGAVVSRDADLLRRVRMLANHGRLGKYVHEVEGVNSRLDALQAAVLRVKLGRLEAWNRARRRLAALYMEALEGAPLRLPTVAPGAEPVWHLFVVRLEGRDAVQEALKKRGVETGVHYPLPLHLQPAYKHLDVRPGTLPVTEKAAGEVLSLPLYPELTGSQLRRVCAALRRAQRAV